MTIDWQTAGWPVVRIRDIGRLHGGGTPSRKRPEYFQGTIPWITGQDIPESHVAEISTARDYVTEEAVEESATRIAPAGAVLVTTRVSVGKTAVAGCPICFSQDVTAIIIHSAAIALPSYVAYFLRSRREALLQKNQGSTIAGITRDSLALEQIPLPPLSEQQRIVEILHEAEAIRSLRAQAEVKTTELVPSLFSREFGRLDQYKSQPLSSVLETIQTGWSPNASSFPARSGAWGVLKLSAVTSGRFLFHENKELPTNIEPDLSLAIRPGDVLLSRKNTRELVGACTYVWETPPRLIFPDLVFRLILNNSGLVSSKYLWALLNSAAFSPRVRNLADGAASSMANIPINRLEKLKIPIPPIAKQDAFTKALDSAHEQEVILQQCETGHAKLIASLAAHAFAGQLTTNWREAHKEMLALEAHERDAALKQAGAISSLSRRARIQEVENVYEQRTDGIYSDLNREQHDLLARITRRVGGVNYARYFSAQSLSELMEGPLRRNPQAIEGHLAVLAVRGLVIPVSREEQTKDTGEFVFGNAYRLPLKDQDQLLAAETGVRITTESGAGIVVGQVVGDLSRGRELERLAAQLEKERALT
jgi:type I restriction enzyme S subunit